MSTPLSPSGISVSAGAFQVISIFFSMGNVPGGNSGFAAFLDLRSRKKKAAVRITNRTRSAVVLFRVSISVMLVGQFFTDQSVHPGSSNCTQQADGNHRDARANQRIEWPRASAGHGPSKSKQQTSDHLPIVELFGEEANRLT